jgi:hypothetical protein
MLDLTVALRAHAQGLYCLEAAIELLIGHASWLRRDDFVDRFVHSGNGSIDATPIASVDWLEAISVLDQGRLPCSGGEGRILRLAASLAHGIPVDLRHVLTGLDSNNAKLVSRAVKHATGHR